MDEKIISSNFNAVKEMLLDEDKIITYVSLSKDLCIHVNHSKRLLASVIEDVKSKQPNTKLNVNYIVSGLCPNNNARTTVCSEADITSLRKTFRIIFFEHIYSANIGLPTVDSVAFMAINRFEDLPLCTGVIKNTSCLKRTSDEIGSLKSSSQECVIKAEKISTEINKTKRSGETEKSNVKTAKVKESKSEPLVKIEITSPAKESMNEGKSKIDKKNGHKTQKGITGFFNKSNSLPNKKVVKEQMKSEQKIIVKKEKEEIPKINSEDMEVDEPEPDKENKIKRESPKLQIKHNVKQIKKNAKVDKKRKRVLHVSDSESEDEKDIFADSTPQPKSDSEDEIPPTPAIQMVKITSGIVNPKKRRKIVDKTYTDEDGYILTKKEEVYESCSEPEQDEISVKENVKQIDHVKTEVSPKGKKNGVKAPKKKISPPQKGKQATLMNFFKKM